MNWIFFILYNLVRASMVIYVRELKPVGVENIPKKGGVIFAANHPNNAIDAICLVFTCGRLPLSFWAKAPLFANPISNYILRSCGGIPVRRRIDSSSDTTTKTKSDNTEMFTETLDVLRGGGSFVVFPEGTSYTRPQLLELKDGASWIALEAARQNIPFSVVPSGLIYLAKDKFRSRVVVQYGKPFEVSSELRQKFISATTEEERKNIVKQVTHELDHRLHEVTLNAPDWNALRISDTACRIFLHPNYEERTNDNEKVYESEDEVPIDEKVSLTKRFIEEYHKLREDPEVLHLKNEVEAYQDELDSLHLKDTYVRQNPKKRNLSVRVALAVFDLLITFPLAMLGFVLHSPIYFLAWLVARSTPYAEERSTFRVLVLMFFGPVNYILWALLFGLIFEFKYSIFFLLGHLIVTILHVDFLQRQRTVTKSIVAMIWVFIFLLGGKKKLLQLRERRHHIRSQMYLLMKKYT